MLSYLLRYIGGTRSHSLLIFGQTLKLGACDPVDRALDSRLEGLGFDSQCWPSVEVSGKPRIPHCSGPPSHNGYLMHRSQVGSIVAGCIGAHLARGKVKSVEHALSWSLVSKTTTFTFKPSCLGAPPEDSCLHKVLI